MSSGELSSNQIRGYKSTLARDNVSEEAKDHARQILQEHDGTSASSRSTGYDESSGGGDEHTNRVLGGYKATLKNPNVSEEAKDHAVEVLEEAGVNTGA